jgi:hypothetical protein
MAEKRGWSGHVGAITGIAALALSATSLYFTTVRQVDDVRVIADEAPYILVNDAGLTGTWGIQRLTFINSGTRSAAIMSVALGLVKPKGKSDVDCQKNPVLFLSYAGEPFVIKPGEIAIKQFADVNPAIAEIWRTEPGNVRISQIKWYERGENGLTCVRLSAVTPDSNLVVVDVPKYFLRVGEQDEIRHGPNWVFPHDQPYPIIRKLDTVFNQW